MTLRPVDPAQAPAPGCDLLSTGALDLYFYEDLAPAERELVALHLPGCAECRQGLEELALIRSALAARPDVSAPPAGDWSGFMAGLHAALHREAGNAREAAAAPLPPASDREIPQSPDGPITRSPDGAITRSPDGPITHSYVGYLALAALLALVTMSVLALVRSRPGSVPADAALSAADASVTRGSQTGDAAFSEISEQHFERSKLVVLGLSTKDPLAASGADWTYERELASTLLSDTRLYRLTAEERGLDRLARVMRDLEIVLLQTSLTQERDPAALAQIQRLIQKRDLLENMDLFSTMGP